MSDNSVILQYLKSIEGKIDNLSDDIANSQSRIGKLEQKHAEQGGMFKAALFFAGIISSAISYLFQLLHK